MVGGGGRGEGGGVGGPPLNPPIPTVNTYSNPLLIWLRDPDDVYHLVAINYLYNHGPSFRQQKIIMQCDRGEKQLKRKTKLRPVFRLVSAVFSQEGSWLGCC